MDWQNRLRETVRAILIDKFNRIFLVQHRELNPNDLGKWSTIGGGIDSQDQSEITCLKREIREEFGEHAVQNMIFGDKLTINRRIDRIDHFFLVKYCGNDLVPQVPDEIMNYGWFSVNEANDLPLFFGFETDLARAAIHLIG
jgi:8-oxo-dGTP pyrophosphatase MutT (NUDIX family)